MHYLYSTKRTSNESNDCSSKMIKTNTKKVCLTQAPAICLEDELFIKNYIDNTLNIYYGLPDIKVKKLIYQLINKYGKSCPQSWHDNKIANDDWYQNFLTKYSSLFPLKKYNNTLSNKKIINIKNSFIFYNNLNKLLNKYSFSPQDIWNVNDMNITTVDAPTRLIKKDDHISLEILSGNCNLVTVIIAINAQGCFTPPYFIFPCYNFDYSMINDAPIGSNGTSMTNGQMKSTEFINYLEFYKKQAKPSKYNKCLLILDSDETHYSIDCIDYCKNNDIILLFTPPNFDKTLQPFVSSIYDVFEDNINHAANCWISDNCGDTMSIKNIPGIVKKAFAKSINYSNIILGFEVTGINPFDKNKYNQIKNIVDVLDKSEQMSSLNNFKISINKFKKINDKVEVIDLEFDSDNLQSPNEIIIPDIIEDKITNNNEIIIEDVENKSDVIQCVNDYKCFVCLQDYILSKPGEWWFQCQYCEAWLHENCNKSNLKFICHDCASKTIDLE